MFPRPGKAPLGAGAAFAFCACVAGCAVTGASPTTAEAARLLPAGIISAEDAKDAIAVGKSTKADVMAALGKATVVGFDSGFEVWVYQFDGDEPVKAGWLERTGLAGSKQATPAKTEFVVLFAPSGIVTKTRVRPPPARRANSR